MIKKLNFSRKLTCLVVSAHLRYEADVLFNNLLSSLFVFDIINQETQTKGTTFHFFPTQISRLVYRSVQTAECGFYL